MLTSQSGISTMGSPEVRWGYRDRPRFRRWEQQPIGPSRSQFFIIS